MKNRLFLCSLNLVAFCLRWYGWTQSKRPDGFPPSPKRPFWRTMPGKGSNHIETANFQEAVNAAIEEAKGA